MKLSRLISAAMAAAVLAVSVLTGSASAVKKTVSYPDVASDRWSYDDIDYVSGNNEDGKVLMNGTDGYFLPEGNMERCMVVTVLYRLDGSPSVDADSSFNDVAAGDYFASAVTWAKTNNITQGVTSKTFAPHDYVTREQLAAFIMRFAEYKYVDTSDKADISSFADAAEVDSYATDAIAWANQTGLIRGITENGGLYIKPLAFATREQFAAIMHRYDTYDFSYVVAYTEPTAYSHYTEPDYPLVTDADIYVSTTGDDSNPGTLASPVATFAKAKELVRDIKKTATDEIKVAFMAGNYGSLDNLEFTAEDAGTEAVPITYCKYGDGDVTFSNGIDITESDFSHIDSSEYNLFYDDTVCNSIYKVDLSGKLDQMTDSNVLFSETGVCWEARTPNKSLDGTDVHYDNMTTTVDEFSSIKLQNFLPRYLEKYLTSDSNGNYLVDGLKVTGFLRTGWLVDTFPVKSYDKDTQIITFDFENWNCTNGYPITPEGGAGFPLMYEGRTTDTVFFSNLSKMLNMKGEYWFDKSTKTLYLYDPSGTYSIGTSGTFMTIDRGADYLTFTGLTFKSTTDNA